MKKFGFIGTGVALTAVLTAAAQPTFAQSTTTRVKKKVVAPAPQKNPFTGNVDLIFGQDSNPMIIKNGTQGSFFQISPSVGYKGEIFNASAGASIKDFGDQQLSNNAKETSANVKLGANTVFGSSTKSNTNVSLGYSDSQWPNLFGTNNQETLFGAGMPIRYFETKFSQSLDWKLDRLNVNASGSYANRDYTNNQPPAGPEIFGPGQFQNDQDILSGQLRLGLQISENLEVVATPSVAQKKYTERRARETDGSRANGALTTEFVTNNLRAEVKINLGSLELVPYVQTGVQLDQVNGGEDFNQTGGGLSASATLIPSINMKLSASYGSIRNAYDNWVLDVTGGGKRIDDETNTGAQLSFDLSRSFGFMLDYQNIQEESTFNDTDENYTQEIISTGLSLKF